MHRRRFLTTTAIGVATVAGCTQDDDSESGPSTATEPPTDPPTTVASPTAISTDASAQTTTTPTETSTPTLQRSAEAADHIEEARDSIDRAITEWESGLNNFSVQTNWRFEPSPMTTALDTADSELEAARSSAGPDQEATIDTLETQSQLIRQLVESTNSFANAVQHWNTAGSYSSAGRYDDGVEAIQNGRDDVSDAQSKLSDARDTGSNVDDDAWSDVDYESFSTKLDGFEKLLNGYDIMLEAGVNLMRADKAYTAAGDHYQNEDYSQAQADYWSAEDEYAAARDIYQSNEDSVTADYGIKDYVIRWGCKADRYREISSKMAAAADDANSENWEEAAEHQQAANRVSTTCS